MNEHWLSQIEGWLLVPHELGHVVAHRLLGIGYTYRLGQHSVKSSKPLGKRARLLILLFPLILAGVATLGFALLWAVTASSSEPLLVQFALDTYRLGSLDRWRADPLHSVFTSLVYLTPFIELCSSFNDRRQAFRLIFTARSTTEQVQSPLPRSTPSAETAKADR